MEKAPWENEPKPKNAKEAFSLLLELLPEATDGERLDILAEMRATAVVNLRRMGEHLVKVD